MLEVNFEIPEKVLNLILNYYPTNTLAYTYYYTHCIKVTELALRIANANETLYLDTNYIVEAGMLHDIGIIKTSAPEIGCFGEHPYIAHATLGREILEQNGFENIAPICERHVGVGLTKEDIVSSGFPLPIRDMIPISYEEKLICYADKFYSKTDKHLTEPKSLESIRKKVLKYGDDKAAKFEELVKLFGNPFE